MLLDGGPIVSVHARDSIPPGRCMLGPVCRAVAALAAAALVSGCAVWPVTFSNATPRAPRLVPAWQTRPAGPGPLPAIVLLHGCHGVAASTHEWARWFTARGYVALIVDSWGARDMTEDCSPRSPDPPASERFDDVVGALRFLHGKPDVDRERIGVIGWSSGGAFAM